MPPGTMPPGMARGGKKKDGCCCSPCLAIAIILGILLAAGGTAAGIMLGGDKPESDSRDIPDGFGDGPIGGGDGGGFNPEDGVQFQFYGKPSNSNFKGLKNVELDHYASVNDMKPSLIEKIGKCNKNQNNTKVRKSLKQTLSKNNRCGWHCAEHKDKLVFLNPSSSYPGSNGECIIAFPKTGKWKFEDMGDGVSIVGRSKGDAHKAAVNAGTD